MPIPGSSLSRWTGCGSKSRPCAHALHPHPQRKPMLGFRPGRLTLRHRPHRRPNPRHRRASCRSLQPLNRRLGWRRHRPHPLHPEYPRPLGRRDRRLPLPTPASTRPMHRRSRWPPNRFRSALRRSGCIPTCRRRCWRGCRPPIYKTRAWRSRNCWSRRPTTLSSFGQSNEGVRRHNSGCTSWRAVMATAAAMSWQSPRTAGRRRGCRWSAVPDPPPAARSNPGEAAAVPSIWANRLDVAAPMAYMPPRRFADHGRKA